jgi:glycosyltransferase involved in cell wall biosynthesis
MASCTPVISSNQSGLPETVSSAGILTDPNDIDAFAEQQYRVLTDPGLRETLRQRGAARAAEFSWERTARATLDVMQKAIS